MCRVPRCIQLSVFVLAGVVASGCASSLVNQWTLPGFGAPMRSLLVIAVKPDDVHRRIIEDAFVKELARYGVAGTAAYGAFPALPDTQSVKEYVLANRLDGVLVVAKLPDREHTETFTPPYATTETRIGLDRGTGRYTTYTEAVAHEATTTQTEQIVPHRVDVWYSDHKGGQLVWTAESRSVDPSSVDQVTTQLTSTVLPAMAKTHVIPPRQ